MRQLAILFMFLGLSINVVGQASVAMLSTKSKAVTERSLTSNNVLSANFELHRGKIIVQATIDEMEGHFLLDTGAESLIINGIPNGDENFQVEGLTEISRAEPLIIKKMTWENQVFEDIDAFKVDLQDLEKSIGVQLTGIIGHSMIGQGALYIDYQNQKVSFLLSSKPKDLKKQGWKAHHLFQKDHLLAIGIKVNGKKFYMGLDTGAEINLIATPSDVALHPNNVRNVCGIAGEVKQAKLIQLETVQINKSSIEIGDLYYYPCSSFADRFDSELSGLLGFPFFANNSFILDLANEVLYLK